VAYFAGSSQYDNWLSFRASLPDSDVTAITVKGSEDPVGRTCDDPDLAQQIADAMRAGAANFPVSHKTLSLECGDSTWNTGSCSTTLSDPNNLELNVGPRAAVCESNICRQYVLRPGSMFSGWGGLAGPAPCSAPTQTMTVVVDLGLDLQVLDHYVLYDAKEPKHTAKFEKRVVTLDDQFEFGMFNVDKLEELGNPAETTVDGDETTSISNPDVHLVSYKIKKDRGEPKHQKMRVRVTNQFGEITLDTKKPDRLLVPSAKSLDGWVEARVDPPVDHFKCYKVKVTEGTPEFEELTVLVKDQFHTDPFPEETVLLEVKKPKRLCNPVNKNGEGILDEESHLLCYGVKRPKGEPKFERIDDIFVNNQFGPLQIDAKKEKELCVPSTKEDLGEVPKDGG
jgi:hypothetical protein